MKSTDNDDEKKTRRNVNKNDYIVSFFYLYTRNLLNAMIDSTDNDERVVFFLAREKKEMLLTMKASNLLFGHNLPGYQKCQS